MSRTIPINDETARLATVHENLKNLFQQAAQAIQPHTQFTQQFLTLGKIRNAVVAWPDSWNRVQPEVRKAFVTDAAKVNISNKVLYKMQTCVTAITEHADELATEHEAIRLSETKARLNTMLTNLNGLVEQLIDSFPQARDAQQQHVNSMQNPPPDWNTGSTFSAEPDQITDEPNELPETASRPTFDGTSSSYGFGSNIRPLRRADTDFQHIMRDISVDNSKVRGGDWVGDSRNMNPEILKAARPSLYENFKITGDSTVILGNEFH